MQRRKSVLREAAVNMTLKGNLAVSQCVCEDAFPSAHDCFSGIDQFARMTPHASLTPALPEGWVVKSSGAP